MYKMLWSGSCLGGIIDVTIKVAFRPTVRERQTCRERRHVGAGDWTGSWLSEVSGCLAASPCWLYYSWVST